MAIFNSYVSLPEGKPWAKDGQNTYYLGLILTYLPCLSIFGCVDTPSVFLGSIDSPWETDDLELPDPTTSYHPFCHIKNL